MDRTPTNTLNDRLERLSEWIDFGDDFHWRLAGVALMVVGCIVLFTLAGYLSGGGWSFIDALWTCAGGR